MAFRDKLFDMMYHVCLYQSWELVVIVKSMYMYHALKDTWPENLFFQLEI